MAQSNGKDWRHQELKKKEKKKKKKNRKIFEPDNLAHKITTVKLTQTCKHMHKTCKRCLQNQKKIAQLQKKISIYVSPIFPISMQTLLDAPTSPES